MKKIINDPSTVVDEAFCDVVDDEAGHSLAGADLPGLAGFTAQMLEEGTATRSAPAIADDIAQLGAFMDTGSSDDVSTVSLLALTSTFARALEIVADIVQRPAFPAAEIVLEFEKAGPATLQVPVVSSDHGDYSTLGTPGA